MHAPAPRRVRIREHKSEREKRRPTTRLADDTIYEAQFGVVFGVIRVRLRTCCTTTTLLVSGLGQPEVMSPADVKPSSLTETNDGG
jgi:hypothetical protein